MKIKLKNKLVIFLLICFISCQEGDKDFVEMKFNQLPHDVQVKFVKMYSYVDSNDSYYLPPFSECENINPRISCAIEYKYHNPFLTTFIPQKFVIKSNSREVEIPFGNLENVFIIKNDSIFYPFTLNGGMTAMGEPRSNYIRIDTLKFRAKKMLKAN